MVSSPATPGITCLLTIHGIGFQQAPDDAKGVAGYADSLHQTLHGQPGMAGLLGDDPRRQRTTAGLNGPVYVESSWPPDASKPEVRSTEAGLERLGRRADPRRGTLEEPLPSLVEPGRSIAHVALVYTPLEETGPDVSSTLELAARGLFSAKHYATLVGGLTMLGRDVAAILHPPQPAQVGVTPASITPASANTPRLDLQRRETLLQRLLDHVHGGATPPGGASGMGILRSVEDDVAGYFARNVLRERERDFVREVMLRLQLRGDVSRVVVNSHSQGTVVAFDTLRTLPLAALDLVCDWLTLGSPLRKYAEILDWGTEVGAIAEIPRWTNFWDPLDPVADPLAPPPGWRRGDPLPGAAAAGLFQAVDTESGIATTRPIADVSVDNVGHTSAPGLRAHDYWGNTAEVVPQIASRLRQAAERTGSTAGPA